jgi:hypothetical protein
MHGPQVAGLLVDLSRLRATHRVRAVRRTVETRARHPSMDDTGILPRGDMRLFPEPAREQISALPTSSLASHSPMALRVCSVIWNCTGRPVFFWITVARSRTMPPPTTSSIVKPHEIATPGLLSMARLNIARSRRRPSSCRRTRMVQTSFGFSGRFWPSAVPCSRVRAGKGRWGFRSSSSSPMPAPSTSAPDRPRPAVTTYRKAFIAPKTVISGGRSHFARFAVGPPPVSRSHEQLPPQEP